ncbi:hypothetical protein V3C99_001788 [Haemonchus contortus]|uniref:HA domain-containing protein n=1 Tax=Haemonchus contortus TaxID=6289 RepID=A0A7I4YBP6_HAECO
MAPNFELRQAQIIKQYFFLFPSPFCSCVVHCKIPRERSWTSISRRADPADLEQRCEVILRCAKETLGETRGGSRGDKEAWFWNDEVQHVMRQKKSAYKRWQRTRAPGDLSAYRTSKRLAKAAVAKAKNTEMDALYEKLDNREGEKFVFRLAKARHRATQDIGVVKSVRNSEGAILRKPGEVRRRWKEYFDGLLNEEFARQNSPQLEATADPFNLWTENEVRRAMGKMKVGKATCPDGVPRGKVAHTIPEHCHR